MGRLARGLLIGWIGLAAGAHAQLTAEERAALRDALYLGNMSEADLRFFRQPFEDSYRPAWVRLALEDPVGAADRLLERHARSRDASAPALLAMAREMLFGSADAERPAPESPAPAVELPPELDAIAEDLTALIRAVALAQREVEASLAGLSGEERSLLEEGLPRWAAQGSPVEFRLTTREVEQGALLAALAKVDRARIERAAIALASEVQRRLPALRDAAVPRVKWVLPVEGLTVVLAGPGDDLHREPAHLLIDWGGNDQYFGRPGGAIGGASVLVDLGGSDTYDTSDVAVGAGLLGIGLAFCSGGHDAFRGRVLGQGAGLAGVGLLWREGGNDSYDLIALGQGFGAFGVGVLVDRAGRDRYDLAVLGQGAGLTQGVGWLVERAGSDVYRAGGLYLNQPLFADVHFSFAQGFGMGMREDTGGISGGIGLLSDHGGADSYLGETYCQAASYWFALGSLFDADGHDVYSAYHYAQASAMHLCAAFLFDAAGDDRYVTQFGASLAIGHDWGVAWLLDRAGNDLYFARDGTPGIGNANGLGVFVDVAGEDRYQGPPGRGNPARGSGSLGVFVDADGPDRYFDGLADGQAAVTSLWGIAWDRETRAARPEASGAGRTEGDRPGPPGSRPLRSDEEMERLYRRASRWAVGIAQKDVADAIAELVLIGRPALDWMIERHLATADRLALRAFAQVIGGIGPEAKAAVVAQLDHPDPGRVRSALRLCLDLGIEEAASYVPRLLERDDLARLAAQLAGTLRVREAVPALMRAAASEDRLLALNALTALAEIGDPASLGTGQALLGSSELPLRKAAVELVAKFPAEAIATARVTLGDSDEQTVRTTIEVLGRIGSDEALGLIAERLLDPRPGVRISALLALDGRCPEPHRADFLRLREDGDPRVRAVAQRTSPVGRGR